MKIFKYISVGFGVLIFAYLAYFASHLSGTYIPLKSYSFAMSPGSLNEELRKVIDSNPSWTLHLTDTVGSGKTGRSFHGQIRYKDESKEFSYDVKLDEEADGGSQLSIAGAFDLIKKSGGHKLGDADVKKLTEVLEVQIIDKLPRQ